MTTFSGRLPIFLSTSSSTSPPAARIRPTNSTVDDSGTTGTVVAAVPGDAQSSDRFEGVVSSCVSSLRRALAAGLIPLVLGLWGCGAAPPKEPVAVVPPKEVTPPPTGISLELPPSEFSEVFGRAEQQLDGAEWMAAEASLAELPRNAVFTPEDGQYLVYLQARIAFVRGNHQQALRELGTLNQASVYPSIRYRALDLSRQIESLAGNNMASARLGASLLPMAPAPQAESLRRDIWRDLQRTGSSELNAALAGETDSGLRGWFELANLVRGDYPGREEIELWQATNPQHPAAQPLPGGPLSTTPFSSLTL